MSVATTGGFWPMREGQDCMWWGTGGRLISGMRVDSRLLGWVIGRLVEWVYEAVLKGAGAAVQPARRPARRPAMPREASLTRRRVRLLDWVLGWLLGCGEDMA